MIVAEVAIVALMIVLIATTNLLNLSGNASRSEPRGFYRITHEPLRHGIFVVLKLPLKQAAALPGDTVRVTPEGSYINGRLWPHSGIPADVHSHYPFGTYVLKPGELWVLGDNPRSYDSRYFGMIPESLISATAEPFLTLKENQR